MTKFNKIVSNLLKEQEISKEERLRALKSLQTKNFFDDIDEGFIRDIVSELCSIETTRWGGGLQNIVNNSNPELIERTGDGISGNMTFKLTLPTKTIDKYTPRDVLWDWIRKYREWRYLDLDTIDFDNINLEDYGIEQSDLYRAATRDMPGVYIEDVEDLGNDMGRFTISYGWAKDY